MGALLLAAPGHAQPTAQSLTGTWQGVETDAGEPGAYWPSVLRVQQRKGRGPLAVLYQEMGTQPGVSVTFRMEGPRTPTGLRLVHGPKLNETGRTPDSYWCDGAVSFAYDAAQEKLTGRATYRPVGTCGTGTFTLYRVRLKSAAAVPAGVASTLRVSGRGVRWYADAELRQPLATGNSYRTRLRKTTTFYLTQGYYPSGQSGAVPITVRATGAVPKPKPLRPVPTRPDTFRPAPPVPAIVAPTPVVLPTVLFRLGTAELLPEAGPALTQLAAELRARPALRLQVAGHTDRVGEPEKNQALSEQRAEAVKACLVAAGVAPERLSTVGYGDARPLHPSPDARNRRVEVAAVE